MANNPGVSINFAAILAQQLANSLYDCSLQIYSGIQPTNIDSGIGTSVLLATIFTGYPNYTTSNTSNTASVTVTDLGTAVVSTAGTATWFQFSSLSGSIIPLFMGSVGISGCDLNLDNNVLASGDTVTISNFSLSLSLG